MASTATRLSSQDRKDLEKFTKYLVYKCMQVIVQSRLGEKTQSYSAPFSSAADWFNLAITDIPEVLSETKKVFSGPLGGSMSVGQNICLEISLHTVDGETMILETWWMTITDTVDPNARVSYTVYNRMGVLLKSLICATRVTPAYRLSRKQGPDTFVVCYRIYTGEPQFHLGEGHQKSRVGMVPTPTGTIVLSVAYRTKMLMSPQTSLRRDVPFELKDDHFMEGSPRKFRSAPLDIGAPFPCRMLHKEPRRPSIGDDGMIFAADPPDPCSHDCPDHCNFCNHESSPNCGHMAPHMPYAPPFFPPASAANGEKDPDLSGHVRLGAFAPRHEHSTGWRESEQADDVPFMNLLIQGDKLNANDGPLPRNGVMRRPKEEETGLSKSAGSASNKSSNSSLAEDYVMIQLKTPFAGSDANSELNGFYRACQGAPSLSMLQEKANVQDTLNCITEQLADFEAHAKDFDDFVNSIKVTNDG